MDYNEEGLKLGLASRAKAAADQIIDVCYADLVANPLAEIRRILGAAELEGDDAWLNALPTGRPKVPEQNRDRHPYALAQFGLDADTVNRRFADYIKTYELES